MQFKKLKLNLFMGYLVLFAVFISCLHYLEKLYLYIKKWKNKK